MRKEAKTASGPAAAGQTGQTGETFMVRTVYLYFKVRLMGSWTVDGQVNLCIFINIFMFNTKVISFSFVKSKNILKVFEKILTN